MRAPEMRLAAFALFLSVPFAAFATAAPQACLFNAPCGTTVLPGPVVGQTWTPAGSPYCVTGDLVVAGLTIQPDVVVRFASGAKLSVSTTIDAQGSAAKPIVFTSATSTSTWGGIEFLNSPPGSILKYCRIERSSNSGIRITNSTPTIDHCAIVDNTAPVAGGGLWASLSPGLSLTIRKSEILRNIVNPSDVPGVHTYGGGLFIDGECLIDSCRIAENEVRSTQTGLQIWNVRGGGVYIDDGAVTMQDCLVATNRAVKFLDYGLCAGGGIYSSSATLTLANVVACDNRADGIGVQGQVHGDGIYAAGGGLTIENSTTCGNHGEGLRRAAGTVSLLNSIVYFNTGPEIVGAVTVNYSNVQGGAPGSGIGNIDFNPAFAANTGPFLTIADVGLLLGSPCVDAGDPDPTYDDGCSWPSLSTPSMCASGAGSRNDMGAFGGPGACGWNDAPNDGSWGFGLEGTPGTIPAALGGLYTLDLNAGCDLAGKTYVLGGTLDGIAPGFTFGGRWIPLNYWSPCFVPNPWFGAVLGLGPGTLNPGGAATIVFQVPADPVLSGLVLHHTYGVIDFSSPTPLQFVSNAVRLQL